MSLPQIFQYKSQNVRTVIKNGEVWFIAKDVCQILEIGNVTDALNRLDADEFDSIEVIDTMGRNQLTKIINEPGLYSLILGSRKPEAKEFKRWITHDVIPSIRKHGAYMTDSTLENVLTSPDFIIQLATKLKDEKEEKERERQARIAAESKIEADRPLVLFAESLQISKDSILVADLAKLLKQNGIDIGEVRLFKWLRAEGYLIKSGSEYNMPTQRSMDLKVMEIKIGYRGSSDGTTKITRTPKVTGKGQIYFINKFKDQNQVV